MGSMTISLSILPISMSLAVFPQLGEEKRTSSGRYGRGVSSPRPARL
jgi:hypothetical protein